MPKLTINDVNLSGKRVFVRVDYNVPMEEKEGRMVVTDLTRVRETLPTLEALIGQGARLVLAAHLGRPKGKREPSMSLAPVAIELGNLLGKPVRFVDDCVGEKVQAAVAQLKAGDVLLLENVRYYAEEEANEPAFAARLAESAEAYVNDAFGSAHRAHASTEGVARIVSQRGGLCVAGLLMERELKFLGDELESPARPFVVILGGAKVSDKIMVIDRLLERADTILVGGAMAYTFRLAQGRQTGRSLVEADKVEVAKAAATKAQARNVPFLLPVDDVVAVPVKTDQLDKKGKPVIDYQNIRTNADLDCPSDAAGLDIGPATVKAYEEVIARAKTILWNGPMGLFEDKRFAAGTYAIAQAVARATGAGAKSIIGGGDSVKALNKAKLGDKVTFMSTGGGASLEFLEGRVLPGVAALTDRPAEAC
ncbi:MAG: phosphoglycerate kinase [Verrucomicrobia bacterium]|jgi:phosphoglycerate kinase|nr:phosphoglycerate kinase [Verrucomicrobiota bacterium]OQC62586.1 MAG: Bifunctional PGK [Verrucomicrobia bacterium ADurb.Bin006]MDI9380603.1 phosphoglycerate kinase [Verrucomicrobiota bacterium]NMD21666.1 phosphoglycerate kinase [Verrucomicrobiota bacterium]HNU99668.1 phosphoglycerate kinase [Verrucomicrobiota bacterium]